MRIAALLAPTSLRRRRARSTTHATALAILARLRNVTEDRSLRANLGETTFTLARLERAAGRNGEACSAYARAFVTYEGLSAADRGMGMPDPLPDIATHASACGLADAKTWLATGKSLSQSESLASTRSR